LRFKIDGSIDLKFKDSYEDYMMEKCGGDELPNPKKAKHGIFHNQRPWEYDKVFRYGSFRAGDVVLDTGAMHTYFCIYLAQFVKQVYATDSFYWAGRDYMERERLFRPEKWMAYVEEKGGGRIKAESADLQNLQYPDRTFDKVLCISTIEHVKDDIGGIKELARVIRPGGRLLLTTEFNFHIGKEYSEKDGSYYRIYTRKTFEKLIARSGLKLSKSVLVEKRPFFSYRRHVNAFAALEK
jgi:SAM-dependent methyltransferase